MFSSMAASFGNAGQSDYAAGNSVLDLAAWILKRQYPDLHVTAFNWGPWKGAGMVSENLEREFKKTGISFIELDVGGQFFIHELMYGEEASVLAIVFSDEEVLKRFSRSGFFAGESASESASESTSESTNESASESASASANESTNES
jgi:hypothetical protein